MVVMVVHVREYIHVTELYTLKWLELLRGYRAEGRDQGSVACSSVGSLIRPLPISSAPFH